MLKNSELIKKPYLLTYFNSDKELVKVKTLEFIDNWNSFNYAVAWQGMTFVSNDGKLILEFTVDSKYDLISNFKIDKQ